MILRSHIHHFHHHTLSDELQSALIEAVAVPVPVPADAVIVVRPASASPTLCPVCLKVCFRAA